MSEKEIKVLFCFKCKKETKQEFSIGVASNKSFYYKECYVSKCLECSETSENYIVTGKN